MLVTLIKARQAHTKTKLMEQITYRKKLIDGMTTEVNIKKGAKERIINEYSVFYSVKYFDDEGSQNHLIF